MQPIMYLPWIVFIGVGLIIAVLVYPRDKNDDKKNRQK
jgi:hypothetical protein